MFISNTPWAEGLVICLYLYLDVNMVYYFKKYIHYSKYKQSLNNIGDRINFASNVGLTWQIRFTSEADIHRILGYGI